MLTEIFKSVLLMSAVGGVLGAFLLCVKPITRKLFSPKWQYYIWLTVLIVMILPVRFSLPQKTQNILDIMAGQVQNMPTEFEMQTDNQNTVADIPTQPQTFSAPKINLPRNIFYYLSCIWILGAIFIFFAKIIKYCLFLKAIHKNSEPDTDILSIPKRLKVQRTDMLDAPLIVGLVKPCLYLPDTELSESDLNYILMHELTHYRRHDLLYKWFTMLVLCVHWFNPLVYLVSKQIDLDCEVSCDFAVTSNLTQDGQNSYMNMILGLLANSRSNLRPLTTQMASSKKTLKRRFEMIKNKKKTSKFVSALSAVISVVMLGTTVFASGVLSDLATDDYTVEITNNGEKIELINKPFIENSEVYVPLRETLEKIGIMDNANNQIIWDNGKIDIHIQSTLKNESDEYVIINHQIEIGKDTLNLVALNGSTRGNFHINGGGPILKQSVTYLPLMIVDNMANGFVGGVNEPHNTFKLDYRIYDKDGNNIITQLNNDSIELMEYEKQKQPFGTAELLFRDFHRQDFENMKTYCTENCINSFFEKTPDGYQVFGMKNASVRSIAYANGSSETADRVFLDISLYRIEFDETSVYAQNRSPVSFCLILQRQSDGRYLIDEFAERIVKEIQN